jgi:hypothetical protein
MNWTQWFMLFQVIACFGGAIGFAFINKDIPLSVIWTFYALANIGWFLVASRGVI